MPDLPPLPPEVQAPAIGATSFPSGAHVSGRIHTVIYVVRPHIVSIEVSEIVERQVGQEVRLYQIKVEYVGGHVTTILKCPDFANARRVIAQLGCGDLALTGLAQGAPT